MKKTITQLFFLGIFGLAVLQACTSDNVEDDIPTPGGGSTCDTAGAVTYNGKIKAIFDAYCISCHSGLFPPKGFNLSNYHGAQMVAQSGRLLGAIKHQPGYTAMPDAADPLDECQIAKIEKWINTGIQE